MKTGPLEFHLFRRRWFIEMAADPGKDGDPMWATPFEGAVRDVS